MRCKEIHERIAPYLDGELDEGEAQRFSAHLRQCPRCEARVERLRRVDALVGAIPEEEGAPAWLAPAGHRAPLAVTWLRPLLAATAVLLIVVLLLPLAGRFPRPSPVSVATPAGEPAQATTFDYTLSLADGDYRVTLAGEDAQMLSFSLSEGDDQSIEIDL